MPVMTVTPPEPESPRVFPVDTPLAEIPGLSYAERATALKQGWRTLRDLNGALVDIAAPNSEGHVVASLSVYDRVPEKIAAKLEKLVLAHEKTEEFLALFPNARLVLRVDGDQEISTEGGSSDRAEANHVAAPQHSGVVKDFLAFLDWLKAQFRAVS